MTYTILLQAAASGGFNYSNLVLIGGMIAVFYFFMIRPQQKKQKDTRNFISAIKKGDHIVTVGGLHGKVVSVEDKTITLDVDNKGTKIVFDKTAISLEASKPYSN